MATSFPRLPETGKKAAHKWGTPTLYRGTLEKATGKRAPDQEATVLRITLILVCLCLFIPCQVVAWQGVILDVQDGDTVTVAPGGDKTSPISIRLYGIDAPESDQPWGDMAHAWLARELPSGADVEVIPFSVDRYGRSVALVVRHDRTLNAELVSNCVSFGNNSSYKTSTTVAISYFALKL